MNDQPEIRPEWVPEVYREMRGIAAPKNTTAANKDSGKPAKAKPLNKKP